MRSNGLANLQSGSVEEEVSKQSNFLSLDTTDGVATRFITHVACQEQQGNRVKTFTVHNESLPSVDGESPPQLPSGIMLGILGFSNIHSSHDFEKQQTLKFYNTSDYQDIIPPQVRYFHMEFASSFAKVIDFVFRK